MTRLLLDEILLKNLQGKVNPRSGRIYMARKQTRDMLKALTGVDFGYNVFLWKLWLKTHKYEGIEYTRAKEASKIREKD